MTCNCLKKNIFKEAEEINIKIICENKNLDTFDQCAALSILKFVYEISFDYLIKNQKISQLPRKKSTTTKTSWSFRLNQEHFAFFWQCYYLLFKVYPVQAQFKQQLQKSRQISVASDLGVPP